MKTRFGVAGALTAGLLLAVAGVILSNGAPMAPVAAPGGVSRLNSYDVHNNQSAQRMIGEGRDIFRFDTFGSEAFWGDALKLHYAIVGSKLGGEGPGLSPKTALALGLRIDAEALPAELTQQLAKGQLKLDDPATTFTLLKLNAVIGLRALWNQQGQMQSVGIQCALCHSNADHSVVYGVGRRLDGWPNRDLDIGAIINLAPTVKPIADVLGVDEATVRSTLAAWGPGKFDAELILDGKGFRPDGRSAATLIPPAFGLAGVNLHTWTGWGSVTHWNAFVSNLEMQGKGTFYDPRLNDAAKFPIAAKNGFANVRNVPDLTTAKLAPLHLYQLALPAPKPPANYCDSGAATRGEKLFATKATCARCHVPPLFTEPGWNMHTAAEIGIDDFHAMRSPDGRYRTAPLKGLWTHTKGGFYHDGRFGTLRDVVNHYNGVFGLKLTDPEACDLVEYLKSL